MEEVSVDAPIHFPPPFSFFFSPSFAHQPFARRKIMELSALFSSLFFSFFLLFLSLSNGW